MSRYHALEQSLLADSFASVDPALLLKANLAAYAYPTLERAARPPALRTAFLARTDVHGRVRTQVAALVRAWAAVGLEALFYKGFYMAEFVYDLPPRRFYGDVDVCMPEARIAEAAALAEGLGWGVQWLRLGSGMPFTHEALHLVSADGLVLIEVHRYPLYTALSEGTVGRIARAVWGTSETHLWEGVPVRIMQPADAALVGLILNRMWSEDDGRLKPHDYTDLHMLIKQGLTEEALRARAQELGCVRTLEHFLNRCNPWQGVLQLEHPTRKARLLTSLRLLPERVPVAMDIALVKLFRAWRLLMSVLRGLPYILTVLRLLKKHQDVRVLLEAAGTVRARGAHPSELVEISAGIRWGVRLLSPWLKQRAGLCLIRSLALYRVLKERGYAPVFVSGVRRDEKGINGHAWIELFGRPLPHFGDDNAPQAFRENYRHPPRAKESSGLLEQSRP